MSFGIRGRLVLLALIATACVVVLAFTAWRSLEETKVFSPNYNAQVDDMDLLADILPPPAFAVEIYLDTHRYGDFDPAHRPAIRSNIDRLKGEFEAQWAKWIAKASNEILIASRTKARDLGRAEIAAIYEFIAKVDSNADEKEIDAILATVNTRYEEHLASIKEVEQVTRQRIANREELLRTSELTATNQLLYGSLGTVLVLIIGCWLIARSIIRPVTRVAAQLGAGAEQVNAAANEVSAGAQRIAQGASEQAASLEETTASLEELSATCGQNANNARQANALASDAASASEAGENAARCAAAEVAGQMKELAAAIDAIRASTEKTTQVVESIDDIAIQINLLALNAAVEAARAGEAGLGFAVVADEVRNLAARSTEEAKNTSALIREARASTERVHGVSKQVQDYLNRTLDQEVVGSFQKLVGMVRKVAQLSAEVAAASDEQSRGVGQINAAVAQMDKVTQENAANAEQSAAASEEMQGQAVSLREGIVELRQVVGLAGGDEVVGGPALPAPRQQVTRSLPRPSQQFTQPNGNGQHQGNGQPQAGAGRRTTAKDLSPAQMLPLTDAEAKEHQGDFSRF